MKPFTRVRATDPINLPGERLRLVYDPDENPQLHHERVLRGYEHRADAVIREKFCTIELDEGIAAWLHEALGELCNDMPIDGIPQDEPAPAEEIDGIPEPVDAKFDDSDRSKP